MNESTMRSWLKWVFLGPPPEQRAVYQRSYSLLNELSALYNSLERLAPDAESAVRSAIEELRAELARQPVTVLSRYLTSASLDSLEGARYFTLDDLRDVDLWDLKQVPGIGPVSADRILDARDRALEELRQAPLEIPKPDDVTPTHAPFLSALYQRIRSRRASEAMLADLKESRKKLSVLGNEISFAYNIFERIFTTRRNREAFSEKAAALARFLESPDVAEKINRAREVLQEAKPPTKLPDLVED